MNHPLTYLYFKGCQIPFHLPAYDMAVRAVCSALGIELVDMEFNCCGYPVRDQRFEAFILSAARNMALAEKKGLPILTPCMCCFGSLKQARNQLLENKSLRDGINNLLAGERLQWNDTIDVAHLLNVLSIQVGADTIKKRIKRPLNGINIAPHYGCHALRPSAVTGFDNPFSPVIFESLVDAIGAAVVSWPLRTECCGSPLWKKNNTLSLRMTHKKLESAAAVGADILATGCTWCQLQFQTFLSTSGETEGLPMPSVILYPRLLGAALGLPPEMIGMTRRQWAALPFRDRAVQS